MAFFFNYQVLSVFWTITGIIASLALLITFRYEKFEEFYETTLIVVLMIVVIKLALIFDYPESVFIDICKSKALVILMYSFALVVWGYMIRNLLQMASILSRLRPEKRGPFEL